MFIRSNYSLKNLFSIRNIGVHVNMDDATG